MSKISWVGEWLPVLLDLPDSCADKREVAITIDDGPSDSTPQLLRVLAKADAKATFFLSGFRIAQHPEMVAAIVEAGHAVYGHGFEHVRLEDFDRARVHAELTAVEEVLARYRPTPEPYLVRLPYASGRRLGWVHRAIRSWSASAQLVHWRLSAEDHTISPRCRFYSDVFSHCSAAVEDIVASPRLNGSIILMHDEPLGVDGDFRGQVTVTLAEILTRALSSRGFAMVPVRPRAESPLWSRFLLEK